MVAEAIAKALGSFRAENLERKTLFDLYSAPSYFPQLLQPIPCFLQGGRGTGKTTVLRYLSYEARITGVSQDQPFHGLYIKFERSQISAFQGGGVDEDRWTRLFSHYINLIQCLALLEYAKVAYRDHLLAIDDKHYGRFLRAFGIDQSTDVDDTIDALYMMIIDLQNTVNNIQDQPTLALSTLAVPLRFLIRSLDAIPDFPSKPVAFLFDEYEILGNYQQRIVNTLLKQADARLTYKIGVREEGLRERVVVGGGEEIRTPADYALISIEERLQEGNFNDFASNVINSRLSTVWEQEADAITDLGKLFPGMTVEDEAELLGVRDVADRVRADSAQAPYVAGFSNYDVFFTTFIANSRDEPLKSVADDVRVKGTTYRNLRNNYDYACLFTLKRRRPGLTKYYCGWPTLLALANGNIRYLLQLVSAMLLEHVRSGAILDTPVSTRLQTECSGSVGNEILRDSEGISLSGARLMKLVLALGQVFHELAVTPEGHAPEITQFEISNEATAPAEEIEKVRKILRDAIMHLALVRASGTKLGGDADTRTYDYMLHPVFSAFFRYSYRRKRKMGLTTSEILGLIENPKQTIGQVLKRHHRDAPEVLPGQLQLFGGFLESGR